MDTRVLKQTAKNIGMFFVYAFAGASLGWVSFWLGELLFGSSLSWLGFGFLVILYVGYLAYCAAKLKVDIERYKEQRLIDTIANQTGSQ